MFKFLAIVCVALIPILASFQDPKPAATKQHPIRFDGTVLAIMPVRDVKAAKKWYCETLGSQILLDLSEMGFCELTTPAKNTWLGLEQAKPGAKFVSNGAATVSFGTTNIRAAKTWMEKRGIKTDKIVVIPETVQLLNFYDPDGNRLVLHQAPQVTKK